MNGKIIFIQSVITCLLQIFLTIDSVIVNTKSGPVNGLEVKYENIVINKFHAIPYAEPPVGVNRFAPTKPVKKWTKTFDATRFGNSCYQQSSPHNRSEDCLLLDVYSIQSNSTVKRPVMFWIHGGGWAMGDGYDQDSFDGTVLASKGVVVVSINYRLGPFGFLYGGDSSAPGNVGILDQIMALHWVKDNIALFGGDPDQITIFGFSAGGWSVSTLIVTPLAKGLFKRAIIQSGATYMKNTVDTNKASHLAKTKKMAQTLGCKDEIKFMECLRNISAENILKHNMVDTSLTYGDEAGVMPFGIEDALKQKKANPSIEVMAGTVSNEAWGWANGFFPKISNLTTHITKEEFKEKITARIGQRPKIAQSVYDTYISPLNESDQKGLRRAFSLIFTDIILLCPTYYFAKEYSKTSDKVYFYVNTYLNQYGGCKEDFKGVCHGDDQLFIFGKPLSHKTAFTKADYEFSSIMTQLWTDFAKTGNPVSQPVLLANGTQVKSWPTLMNQKSSDSSVYVMELNPKTFGNVLKDPYHQRCDIAMKPIFE